MDENKISIIIPVYNAEKTIDRCLNSVCCQTHLNLEIIVINDGSTDSTSKILKDWKKKDSRIIAVEQNNMGTAAARNTGLGYITGCFFCFVDADDFIEDEICERLYKAAMENDLDIVSASIREIYDEDRIEIRQNNDDMPILSGVEAACNMLKYEGGIRTVVWDKLYRTGKLIKLRFDENYVFGEDTLFNYQAFMQCERYGRISYIGYTYDHRMSQITGKKYSSAKLSNIYVSKQIEKMYSEIVRMPNESMTSFLKCSDMENAIKQFQVTIYRQIFHDMILESDYKGVDKKDFQITKKAALKIDKNFVKKFLSRSNYIQWLMYLYWPMGFKVIHIIRH